MRLALKFMQKPIVHFNKSQLINTYIMHTRNSCLFARPYRINFVDAQISGKQLRPLQKLLHNQRFVFIKRTNTLTHELHYLKNINLYTRCYIMRQIAIYINSKYKKQSLKSFVTEHLPLLKNSPNPFRRYVVMCTIVSLLCVIVTQFPYNAIK